MSKAVLISIRPKWCEKIISGEKTIEVRKTRPKMDTPFKCYIYKCGNGKVVGEFLCDQIININGAGRIPSDAARPTCLEPAELHQYLGAATGFGWHISNLRIYDHPRDLWEFTGLRQTKFGLAPGPITRPPQSWRYVEEELWNDAELCGGFDRLRELAEADKDGRVVVLPCKVGETVYFVNAKQILEFAVVGYAVDETGISWVDSEHVDKIGNTNERTFSPDRFGKNTFFTREEAEKALQEMEGKKDGKT